MNFNTATGVLAGTPVPRSGGTYNLLFTASNGVAPDATQNFTLTVNEAPAITSTNAATFATGVNATFPVSATGFPATFTYGVTGTLPTGLTFNTSSGALSGTPAAGSAGTYGFIFTASNGIAPAAGQNFVLDIANPLPVFTPIVPCRVVDTRNAGGPISANSSRRFFFYNDVAGFSWSAQGGAPGIAAGACPGTTLASAGGTLGNLPPTGAVLTVTVVNPTAAGNFIVWGGGPPNSVPNTSMINWSAPGLVLANTGMIPAGGRGSVQDFEVRYNGPSGQAEVVVDVVGYVVGSAATALQCTTQFASGTGTHSNASAFVLSMPACPIGYSATDYGCSNTGALPANIYLQEIAATGGRCTWFNNSGASITAAGYRAQAICCRMPGQ